MVTWIRSILNKQLEGKTADEKVKKYQSMTGLYRDTLLKDWLYMTRSVSNPKYTWIPRVKYGVQIKYESVRSTTVYCYAHCTEHCNFSGHYHQCSAQPHCPPRPTIGRLVRAI